MIWLVEVQRDHGMPIWGWLLAVVGVFITYFAIAAFLSGLMDKRSWPEGEDYWSFAWPFVIPMILALRAGTWLKDRPNRKMIARAIIHKE